MSANVYYELKECLTDLKKFKPILTSVKESERLAILKQQDNSDNTILMLAAKCGYLNIVKCILDLVPAVDLQELLTVQNRRGYTVFHYANFVTREYMSKFVSPAMLYSDQEGNTFIHCATSFGHTDIVKCVVDSVPPADLWKLLRIPNQQDQTTLHSLLSTTI
ncbi:hypothetical protein EB796_009487 [Bugula neritina]|uniref:Uncharacterized protein n=1 Tax=Bugula neritina TaxID=10212 RepID=A0A7J7K0S2_BUGNE|nr:hypothetical protein EB796_009487 [Bugula neritina]